MTLVQIPPPAPLVIFFLLWNSSVLIKKEKRREIDCGLAVVVVPVGVEKVKPSLTCELCGRVRR